MSFQSHFIMIQKQRISSRHKDPSQIGCPGWGVHGAQIRLSYYDPIDSITSHSRYIDVTWQIYWSHKLSQSISANQEYLWSVGGFVVLSVLITTQSISYKIHSIGHLCGWELKRLIGDFQWLNYILFCHNCTTYDVICDIPSWLYKEFRILENVSHKFRSFKSKYNRSYLLGPKGYILAGTEALW